MKWSGAEIKDWAEVCELKELGLLSKEQKRIYKPAEEEIAFFRNGIDNQIEMKNKAIAQRNELKEENTRLREALIHIEEYWNQDLNMDAMADALYEITSTALEALKENSDEL